MDKPTPAIPGGFKALEATLAKKPSIKNPGGIEYSIGKKKFSGKNMAVAAGILRRKAMTPGIKSY